MNNFNFNNFQIPKFSLRNHFLVGIFYWFSKVFIILKDLIQFHLHFQLNLKLQINLERNLLIILGFNFLFKVSVLARQDYFFHLLLFKVFHLFHLFRIQVFLDMSFYADVNEQLTLDFEDVYELSCIRWDLEDKNIGHFYRLFHLRDTISFYWLVYLYLSLMNFH